MPRSKEKLDSLFVSPDKLERIFDDINSLRPIPEDIFVPDADSATRQKELFLDGNIRNPEFTYSRLDNEDTFYRSSRLQEIKDQLPNLDIANKIAYNDIIEFYKQINEFIDLTVKLKSVGNLEDKNKIKENWMSLNKEIFGEPDESTYRSIMAENLHLAAANQLTGSAEQIRQELINLVPFDQSPQFVSRFQPTDETVNRAKLIAESLYGRMLTHIPQKEDFFSPEEVKNIFEQIITKEFGKAAEGWQVVLDESTSINVQASKRLISIPFNRKPVKYEELKGLAIHEIGVHMLRSVMAKDSSVAPLRLGLSNYLESEEGLAKVMEQAIKGRYEEAKPNFYIISGLAYYDGKDYRDCFEIMWRLSVLNKFNNGLEPDKLDGAITASRDYMYRQVFRVFRGTDQLPWFKDLSYYHGSQRVWKYIEDQGADYNTLSLMLMGKADPTNESHRQVLMQSYSVV